MSQILISFAGKGPHKYRRVSNLKSHATTAKKSINTRFQLRSDWSKFNFKRGVFAKPPMPSPYTEDIPDLFCREERWRDLATRHALDERFNAFVSKRDIVYDSDSYDRAVNKVGSLIRDCIGDEKLRPAKFGEVWKGLKHNKSSGYPHFVKKGTLRESTFREFCDDMKRFKKGQTVSVCPCVNSSRCSVRIKPENKPRLVWMYPLEMTVKEGVFMVPLQEALKDAQFMGWSLRWLDDGQGYHEILRRANKAKTLVSLDYSSFDASVAAFVIRDTFAILRECFGRFSPEMQAMWNHVVEYFIHTPLVMWDGVHQKHRGIPSGSFFTQLVGSVANLISIHYISERHNASKHLRELTVLGDDSLSGWVEFPRVLSVSLMVKTAAELGFTVSTAKTKLTSITQDDDVEISFLGMKIRDHYPNFNIDDSDVAARLHLPETSDKCPEDALVRCLGLLWSYGACPKAYFYFKNAFDTISYQYGLKMEDLDYSKFRDPEVERLFTYVLHTTDPWHVPSLREIRHRYIGFC